MAVAVVGSSEVGEAGGRCDEHFGTLVATATTWVRVTGVHCMPGVCTHFALRWRVNRGEDWRVRLPRSLQIFVGRYQNGGAFDHARQEIVVPSAAPACCGTCGCHYDCKEPRLCSLNFTRRI